MRITELEDMESYVEVDSNEIETLINELFPKNLSHYFLFDGERWNDVSVGGVRENIKESVHILTGLSAYREAKNHLKIWEAIPLSKIPFRDQGIGCSL